jgi:hypothetical protein
LLVIGLVVFALKRRHSDKDVPPNTFTPASST